MIQDIKPHQYHNEYLPTEPTDDDYVLAYRQGESYLKKENDTITFLTVKECGTAKENLIYLFRIDDRSYYLMRELPSETKDGFQFEKNWILRDAKPAHFAFAAITGYQIAMWYQNRKFCGHCGHPMQHDKKERMMFCPECGLQEYPKICPAVIVAVRDGDRLLLTKYEGRDYTRYALIAGFAEVGETIEETVHREVMEEVGLKVKNLTFYKSQPWSFSDTLLMGFFCDLDGDDTITLDQEELSLAEWKLRDEIPDEGDNISLTKEMMMVFKRGEDL